MSEAFRIYQHPDMPVLWCLEVPNMDVAMISSQDNQEMDKNPIKDD